MRRTMELCARCRIRPAIPDRPGHARCTECVALLAARPRRRRYRDNLPRARTIGVKALHREVLANAVSTPLNIARPRTRGECRGQERPCPWAGCRHHMALDINPESGAIKINHPHLELWEIRETCSLDVAERGEVTLETVAEVMNLTRERARQIETRGLLKLKMGSPSPDELGATMRAAIDTNTAGVQLD